MTKKLINGQIVNVKDENGQYVPSRLVPEPKKKRIRGPKASEINLTNLMEKHLLLLYRETRSLLLESSGGGKLNKDSAHSMRENLKLILDLKKKEKELLDTLSNEELAKLIEEKANE